MKIKSGKYVLNTEDCTKLKEHTRITRDDLSPRVYFLKTEVLCKMKHSRPVRYFNLVRVEKYIDNSLVKTYTWIQSVDAIELQEFLNIHYTPPKPIKQKPIKEQTHKEDDQPTTPQLTPKERNHLYYLQNKEKIKEKARQNYYNNKEHKNNYSKIYYQEHKDTWKEKYLKK